MYGEVGAAICRAYTLGFLTGLLHLISLWIDYLGYATMHYCQVMVISFCGGLELLMLWMNAHDGGPLEQAINESTLTIWTYYMMMAFSAVKCFTGFHIYRSFKDEYHMVNGGDGVPQDGFWNDAQWENNNNNVDEEAN